MSVPLATAGIRKFSVPTTTATLPRRGVTMDRLSAGKLLSSEHTTKKPGLSIESSVSTLDAFFTSHGKSDPTALAATVASNPALQDAAIALLKYRVTPLNQQLPEGLDTHKAFAVASKIVPMLDSDHRKQFVDEVMFNASHVAFHDELAKTLMGASSSMQLDRALVGGVTGGNSLHANNALGMVYALTRNGHPFSASTRQVLKTAATTLSAKPDANPVLRETATGFKFPDEG